MSIETHFMSRYRLSILGLLFLSSVFFAACSKSVSDAEKLNQSPPTLYDASTAEEIPASQQWMIPVEVLQHHQPVKIDNTTKDVTKLFGDDSWVSPQMNYTNDSGRLFVYIDYAGKEKYGNGNSEIYSIPICTPPSPLGQCSISYADGLHSSSDYIWPYIDSEFNQMDRTIYEPNHPGDTSFFYGYTGNQFYHLTAPQSISILLNTFVQQHHQLAWLRVSVHERPITINKLSFLLTAKYQLFLKWLLLLLPLLIIYDYRKDGGFENRRALITGGLLVLLGTMNTLIWDINYMIVSCLLIALSGVFYIFANHVYKIIYGLGYFIMVVFAYKYYGGFNKHTFTQLALPTLIGIGIFLKSPE